MGSCNFAFSNWFIYRWSVLQVYMATLENRTPFPLVLVFGDKWLKCPFKEGGWSFTCKHIYLDQSLLDLHFLLDPASYTFLVLLGLFNSVIATKIAHNKLKEKADSKETFPKEMSHLLIPQVQVLPLRNWSAGSSLLPQCLCCLQPV